MKVENELGEFEQSNEKQLKVIEELTRKVSPTLPLKPPYRKQISNENTIPLKQVEELTPKAEEATRLKDQMDEYRHAAEKAKKTENVIEKYKKKLEESADLRRSMKVCLGAFRLQGSSEY